MAEVQPTGDTEAVDIRRERGDSVTPYAFPIVVCQYGKCTCGQPPQVRPPLITTYWIWKLSITSVVETLATGWKVHVCVSAVTTTRLPR